MRSAITFKVTSRWNAIGYEGSFFSVNEGIMFVSNADLRRLTGTSTGFSILLDALRSAFKDELEEWGAKRVPCRPF